MHRDAHETFNSGRGKVALGRARLRSRITEESEEICYAVLHLGDQNLSAAVRRYTAADQAGFEAFSADVRAAIRKANLPEVIRLIDRFFAPAAGSAQDRRRESDQTAAAHVHLKPHGPAARPAGICPGSSRARHRPHRRRPAQTCAGSAPGAHRVLPHKPVCG